MPRLIERGLPAQPRPREGADGFRRDRDGAHLTLHRRPVLLPPTLARLVEEQFAQPRMHSMLGDPDTHGPRFLPPGEPPHRPRNVEGLKQLLKQHGLPTRSARNTAMIEAAAELPPIVISALLGVHPGTANTWAPRPGQLGGLPRGPPNLRTNGTPNAAG
ncbi:hypothetical protein [Embleya sp. NPDC001921]